MVKFTTKKSVRKVGKPRADCPQFPHVRGYWAKKVRGRLVSFGRVADEPASSVSRRPTSPKTPTQRKGLTTNDRSLLDRSSTPHPQVGTGRVWPEPCHRRPVWLRLRSEAVLGLLWPIGNPPVRQYNGEVFFPRILPWKTHISHLPNPLDCQAGVRSMRRINGGRDSCTTSAWWQS